MSVGGTRGALQRMRIAIVASAAIAAALVVAPSSAGAADPGVATANGSERPAGVRAFWTPARMRRALPLDGRAPAGGPAPAASPRSAGPAVRVPGSPPGRSVEPRILPGAVAVDGGVGRKAPAFELLEVAETESYPGRTHGRVFGVYRGIGPFSCSGTSVPGNTGGTVITAGHCAFLAGAGFARKWMFVPGYRLGRSPFGSWVARRLVVARGFRRSGRVTVDVGGAEVGPDESGRTLSEAVGTRGIGFDQPRDQAIDAYGYPADPPPFDGERLWICRGRYAGDHRVTERLAGPATMRIGCSMSSGASGGGWVIDSGESGYLYSVNSYRREGEGDVLYGPYFGRSARKVWIGAQRSCGGELPTVIGTGGTDEIVGTPQRDVIVALGGADTIEGGGGRDVICGGGGGDLIDGGGRPDALYGQRGRDVLNGDGGGDLLVGGGGRDRCDGGPGPGRDRARRCELVRGVP